MTGTQELQNISIGGDTKEGRSDLFVLCSSSKEDLFHNVIEQRGFDFSNGGRGESFPSGLPGDDFFFCAGWVGVGVVSG